MSQHDSTAQPTPPPFTAEFDASLTPWNIPATKYLETHNASSDIHINGLASGVAVFNSRSQILLLQRAAHDSMPHRWEIPGGAVDDSDPSILHGAARELFEEAGLVVKRFKYLVGGTEGKVFANSKGTRMFRRFVFAVDVEGGEDVRLDPNEHQDFRWVGEEEVRGERVEGVELAITHELMKGSILEAFGLRK